MNKIFKITVCPNCKKRLSKKENSLFCKNCNQFFPIQKEIFLMLPKELIINMPVDLDISEIKKREVHQIKQKKQEMETFQDLKSYNELMNRAYFRHLKEKIKEKIKNYKFKNKDILEVGAGTSLFLNLFVEDNFVVASDINKTLLLQNKNKGILVTCDAENLPFADNSFDFIYLVGILHHLPNQKKGMMELRRVLKPDGIIFISEPTKLSLNFIYYLLRRLLLLILPQRTLLKLRGCGTPYESFISMKDLRTIFSGFKIKSQKILPLRLPPFKIFDNMHWVVKFNQFLEKVPILKELGTIVFLEIKKEK